jgi:hypothetical protein
MPMTSHSNPDNAETLRQADLPGSTVVESIDKYLKDGMPVFDENGKKVGDVRMHSSTAGYLMVNAEALTNKNLYIPFRLIRTIDEREISLSAPKDALDAQYTQPPRMHTVVQTQLVAGPGGSMVPQTRQVQMLESGYDTTMNAELNSASVGDVASRLAVGMAVYDVDGVHLGNITQYETEQGLLVITKGIFKPTAVVIPFSDIASFSEDGLSVYLSLAEDTIMKEHQTLS